MNTANITNVKDLKNWQHSEMESIKKDSLIPISASKRNIMGIAIGFVGVLVAGMLFLQIIAGLTAIILTAVTGVGLFFGSKYVKNMNPVWQEKMKMKAISARIQNVRDNAVVYLETIKLKRHDILKEKLESLNKMKGFLGKMKTKIDESDDPEITKDLQAQYDTYEGHIELGEKTLIEMGESNKEFEKKVAGVKLKHEFTNIANEFTAISANEFGGKMEEMLTLEAFSSIDDGFNEANARLDNEVLKNQLGI